MSAAAMRRGLAVLGLVALAAAALALTGCGSSRQGPIGAGTATDDYKLSPCACGPAIPNLRYGEKRDGTA